MDPTHTNCLTRYWDSGSAGFKAASCSWFQAACPWGCLLLLSLGVFCAPALAQQDVLIKEIVSREVSLSVAAFDTPGDPDSIVSREVSFFSGQEAATPEYAELVSREISFLVATTNPPTPIAELAINATPDNSMITIDWSEYPTEGQDIVRYDIYRSGEILTNVTGLTPVVSVPGGTRSYTFEGLTPFQPYFFVVVPVDLFGNQDLVNVTYTSSFPIGPSFASREITFFVGREDAPEYADLVSREITFTVVPTNPPLPVAEVVISGSPDGTSVTLDWTPYRELDQRGIDRFLIYRENAAFTDVTGLTPIAFVGAETVVTTLTGLPANRDHFFAVVPVDGLGNFISAINYSAFYLTTAELVSREVSLFTGSIPSFDMPTFQSLVSREITFVSPTTNVPAPVTGIDSGFFVETSQSEFGAVDMDWTAYDEPSQVDVSTYRIYVSPSFFEDVSDLDPTTTIPAGQQQLVLTGLPGGAILYFAVVAEDPLGNFNSAVRAFSAKASVAGVGEVLNLTAEGGIDSIRLTWSAPLDADAFLTGYQVSFDGTVTNLGLAQTEFNATGLEPARGYNIRVRTIDTFGNLSPGIARLGATLLPNPTNLVLTTTGLGEQVRLLWDPVQPTSLVKFYALYVADAPITDVSGLTPQSILFGSSALLGDFTDVVGKHYAVVAVNLLDAFQPLVQSVQAQKQPQIIDFPPLTPSTEPIPLVATASSGLPVTFFAGPAFIAIVEGDTLVPRQGGNVQVIASQPGDDDYWPGEASQVVRLPPIITAFTADGVEIAPDALLGAPNVLLGVTAADALGLVEALFELRPANAPAADGWTVLGTDLSANNGLNADLPIATLDDGDYELRVTVTSTDDATAVATRTVQLFLQPELTLTIPDAIQEGELLTGTVSVQRVRSIETPIILSLSQVSLFESLPQLAIPAGETTVAFEFRAIQDDLIEPLRAITLSASTENGVDDTATFTLLDNDAPLLTLSVDRTVIGESEGPGAVQAILTRDPASTRAVRVRLVNSATSAIQVPSTVTFPAGEESVTFAIGAVDDALPDGPQFADLTAMIRLSNGDIVAMTDPITFEVGDDEGQVLAFLTPPVDFVREAGTLDLTLTRAGTVALDPLDVDLEALPANELNLPSTVSFAAGETSTVITVTGVPNGVADGNRDVRLTATAPNSSPGQISLVVTDFGRPDLVITELTGPTEVPTDSFFDLRYVLANQGADETLAPVTTRLFLSDDRVIGNDLLLTQVPLNSGLAADNGPGITTELSVRAPRDVGTYWLLAIADATGNEDEILESNNARFSDEPLLVAPAYTASVATVTDVAAGGSPVIFTGSAFGPGGAKVPFVLVTITISVDGTERSIAALTDSAGNYEVTWTPLPGEGGSYLVGAGHPGDPGGATATFAQDAFTLLNLVPTLPQATQRFDEGTNRVVNGALFNPTEFDITGIAITPRNLPPGVTADVDFADTIGGGGDIPLTITLNAETGTVGRGTIVFDLTSDQGVTLALSLPIDVRQLVPNMIVEPGRLACSILRGTQKSLGFTIRNTGGADTGPIRIALPDLPWMQLASPGELDSIPPGGEASVSLRLTPPSNAELTLFNGTIRVDAFDAPDRNLPFSFRTVSDLTGDLEVTVVDEFFYFAEGAPKVEGATVIVRDAITAVEITRATTDTNGLVSFPGVTEGWYQLDVDTPDHTGFRGNYFINAGEINRREIFITREFVTYTWTVEEIELEDRYQIDVETTFEVNVPAPVVTISPAKLNIEDVVFLGQTKVVNFTFENHGLIAADSARFTFPSHPFYDIKPLIEDLGRIPAKSTITVPVTITRIGEFAEDGSIRTLARRSGRGWKDADVVTRSARSARSGRSGVPCSFSGSWSWDYVCGIIPVPKRASVPVEGADGDCESESNSSAGGNPWRGGGGAGGGGGFGGGGLFGGLGFSEPALCDCEDLIGNDRFCIDLSKKVKLPGVVSKLTSALTQGIPGATVKSVKSSIDGKIESCLCCQEDGTIGIKGNASVGFSVSGKLLLGIGAPEFGLTNGNFSVTLEAADLGLVGSFSGGGSISYERDCEGEDKWCVTGNAKGDIFAGAEISGKAAGKIGDAQAEGELTGSIGGRIGAEATLKYCTGEPAEDDGVKVCAFARLEAGLSGKVTGTITNGPLTGTIKEEFLSLQAKNLPAYTNCFPSAENSGGRSARSGRSEFAKPSANHWQLASPDLPPIGNPARSARSARVDPPAPEPAPGTNDFPDLEALLAATVAEPVDLSEFFPNPTEILASEEVQEILGEQDGGVCATVKLNISQEAVMTRSAFRATLELANNQEDTDLLNVGFDLEVLDAAGQDVGDRFNIRVTRLAGLDAIDGSDDIPALTSGTAEWTLIPRDSAAPLSNTVYTVGGTIAYDQNGTLLSIPVEPVAITVRPDAALFLKYFHQRDVFSDDPFTDVIEPAIPYSLAVLIDNQGAGPANNLRITSAEPEIVENEKGLLIDFSIIATEVAGQPLSPSLTADFGTIPAGERRVGQWLMTSSLQGLFTDYSATFEHLDGFGDPRISLIKELEIHEMIRLIEAQGDKADGLPDFLVNDIADNRDLPDTVHLSTGGTEPVSVFETATHTGPPTPGNLTLTLTAGLATDGWSYLRIPDPADGAYQLLRVVRSDGLELPLDRNVWVTDRTFIGLGNRPIVENIFHLADCDSTGSYTLFYEVIDIQPDITPPASAVTVLPPNSSALIPVSWGGTDDEGIVAYDIYVQINGGEWTLWLENTTRTSSLYDGEFDTVYAFRSVARDAAGNAETAPTNDDPANPDAGQADATTRVTLANQPPVFAALPSVTLGEGEIFSTIVQATDPESGIGGDVTLSLLSSEPAGLSLDPASGLLQWTSSETDGGQTYTVTLQAADTEDPPGIAMESFGITVTEENRAPELDDLPATIQLDEETQWVFPLPVIDPDIPAQPLVITLGGTVPPGLQVNGTTLLWDIPTINADTSFVLSVTATDTGGSPTQSVTRLLTIDILDQGAPIDPATTLELLGEPLANRTIECGDPIPLPNLTLLEQQLDNACTTLTFTVATNDLPDNCAGPGGVRYDITAANECGGSLQFTQTITVADFTPPTATADLLQLGCDPTDIPAPNAANVIATDACVDIVSVTFLNSVLTTNGAMITRSDLFLATDPCTNGLVVTQQIAWSLSGGGDLNIVPPALVELPCNAPFPAPDASDFSMGLDTTLLEETTDTTSSGCLETLTRVWELTDGCNRSTTATQQFQRLVDTTPPELLNPVIDLGLDPVLVPAPGDLATTSTGCTETVVAVLDATLTSNATTFVRLDILTLTDDCGNQSLATQQIEWTITPDPGPDPIVIVLQPIPPLDLDCNPADIPAADPTVVQPVEPLPGLLVDLLETRQETNGCQRTLQRIWRAASTNAVDALATQTFTWVEDTSPPQVPVLPPVELGINPPLLPDAMLPSGATDTCSAVSLSLLSQSTTTNGEDRIRSDVFALTDDCDNQTLATQEFHWVVRENMPPMEPLVLQPIPPLDLGCDSSTVPTPDPAVVQPPGLNLALVQQRFTNGCERTLHYIWGATDAEGRSGMVTQEITWIEGSFIIPANDVSPLILPCTEALPPADPAPVIALLGPELPCGLLVSVTTNDLPAASLTCPTIEARELVYVLETDCTALLVTQRQSRVDTTPPVAPSLPDLDLGINPPLLPDAQLSDGAVDACSSVSLTLDAQSIVTNGETRVRRDIFAITDACDNLTLATQVLRWVVRDGVPPSIPLALEPIPPAELGCNPADIPAPDASVVQPVTPVPGLLVDLLETRQETNDCQRLLQRVWQASAPNAIPALLLATQTFTWVEDTEAPQASPLPPTELGINPPLLPDAQPPTDTTDACSTITVTLISQAIATNGETRVRSDVFSLTDACENLTLTTQEIRWVVRDDVPPLDPLVLTPIPPLDLGCDADAVPAPDPTLLEPPGLNLALVQRRFTNGCERTLHYIWGATDDQGRNGMVTQEIRWVDATFSFPMDALADVVPPELIVSCTTDLPPGDLTPFLGLLTDIPCGLVVSVTTNDLPANCPEVEARELVYRLATSCTTVLATQRQSRVDTTPPTAEPLPVIELGCNPAVIPEPNPDAVIASDDCSPGFMIKFLMSEFETYGTLRVRRDVYRLIDACANMSTVTQTISWVEDDGSFAMIPLPFPQDLGCNPAEIPAPALYAPPGSTTELLATTTVTTDCTRVRTDVFQISDDCGNTATVTGQTQWAIVSLPVFTSPLPKNVGDGGLEYHDGCNGTGIAQPDFFAEGAGCSTVYTYVWTANNCAGTTSLTQSVTITNPSFFVDPLPLDETLTGCVETLPPAPTLLANICGHHQEEIVPTETILGSCPTVIRRVWSINSSVSHTNTITLNEPTLRLISDPPADITHRCGDTPTPQPDQATFLAALAPACGLTVSVEPRVLDTECIGVPSSEFIYTATDACGATLSVTQRVTTLGAPLRLDVSQNILTQPPFQVGNRIVFQCVVRNLSDVLMENIQILSRPSAGLRLIDTNWTAGPDGAALLNVLLPQGAAPLDPADFLTTTVEYEILSGSARVDVTRTHRFEVVSATTNDGVPFDPDAVDAASLAADVQIEASGPPPPADGITVRLDIPATVSAGETTFNIILSNTGETAATALQVTGDALLSTGNLQGDADNDNQLDPGETWTLPVTLLLQPGANQQTLNVAFEIDGEPRRESLSWNGQALAASLRVDLWNDLNGDGRRDLDEPPATNFPVALQLDGTPIDTPRRTDNNGSITFDMLTPGTGYQLLLTDATTRISPPGIDSAFDPVRRLSPDLTLSAAQTTRVTGGIILPSLISGRIWNDVSMDGLPDESPELFLSSVPVHLIQLFDNGDTDDVATELTDDSGRFLFSNLPPGTYRVTLPEPPENLPIAVNGTSRDLTLRSGDQTTDINFGFSAIPVAIELATFTARQTATAVEITWTTASERDTLGYHLARLDATGLPQIESPFLLAEGPGTYTWTHPNARGGRYVLIELTTDLESVVQDPIAIPVLASPPKSGLPVATLGAPTSTLGAPTSTLGAPTSTLGAPTPSSVSALGTPTSPSVRRTFERATNLLAPDPTTTRVLDVSDSLRPIERRGETLSGPDGTIHYLAVPADVPLEISPRP